MILLVARKDGLVIVCYLPSPVVAPWCTVRGSVTARVALKQLTSVGNIERIMDEFVATVSIGRYCNVSFPF